MSRRRWGRFLLPAIVLSFSMSCAGSAESGPELLVVDQNVLHGIGDEDPQAEPYDRFPERIRLIARALRELQPDIVFLQEVVVQGGDDYGDVRRVLLGALGEEYTAVFGDITGAPIDRGAIGQMTLTRLPVLSAENHHISGPRSIHRVTLQTEHGPLDVYNAHLEGTGAIRKVGPREPLDEIEDVLTFIEGTRSGAGPVILAGDFNAEPDDASVQALLAAGFIDALAAGGDATCDRAGDPGCTSSTLPLGGNAGNNAARRIDYIFVMPGGELALDVTRARLFLDVPVDIGDGRLLWPSDHIGVQATLELRER